MLVMQRSVGQTIVVGDDIEVTIVSIGQSTVRVGIDAPIGKPVYRSEILEQIREEASP